ncbi:MAG: glycosyltransferase family 4 protein, partial [Clostridiales bacterium]|nr:glycosyltransferase family 4 protein [Clostridiales bacterium]
MKKMLFISNISNKITNFSIPSIYAGQQLGYEFHMAANYSGFSDDYSKYNVVLHHIDLSRNPLSIKNLKAFKQMIVLIKKENFEAIHCNTPIGGVLGRLCGKIAKVPKVIYTAHGFHFYKGAPLINRTIFKWAEKIMARYTDVIITMNQEDYLAAQKFKLRKGGKVYYIPGVGVNTEEYQIVGVDKTALKTSLDLNDNDTVMIAMGDLIPRKNYAASIKAVAKAADDKLHFLICGRGPELDELKSLAKELDVEKQIH